MLKPISVRLDEPLYGIPIVYLWGLDLKGTLAEKLGAFYVRKSPRDLYDAWFLIHRGISIDLGLLEASYSSTTSVLAQKNSSQRSHR